jgi:hypothetical protein
MINSYIRYRELIWLRLTPGKITNYKIQITNKSQIQNYKLQTKLRPAGRSKTPAAKSSCRGLGLSSPATGKSLFGFDESNPYRVVFLQEAELLIVNC